jgi:FMN phosphatase YigB (HAD superfamily)
MDAFSHFSRYGWREGRRGSPYFDAAWYAATYLSSVGEAEPFSHYVDGGWQQGCRPSPYFDPAWYLEAYPDVAEAGVEPLSHYVAWGWREGRNPSPYFDVAFYLQDNPDVREAGIEPLLHFSQNGWREKGRDPNPYFSSDWYRERYAALLDADRSPLLHYLETGSAQGLQPGPHFDPQFYREKYPDVAALGEPLAHYLQFGRQERRVAHPDAEPAFDPRVAQWAEANALSKQRVALLSRQLGLAMAMPSVPDIAQATFRQALTGIEVVTFDIFDTLVERRSGNPESIFALLGADVRKIDPRLRDFVGLRKQAELDARVAAGTREVTLAEIWDKFAQATGLSRAECTALSRREAELEIAYCEAKPVGIDLFRVALEEGRQVFLLTDIYLDRATVEAILEKAGISGYRQLYISSEIGSTKHYGGMFEVLLSDTGACPRAVLHVGDNPHSDVVMPRKFGIRALRIEKTEKMASSDTLREWFRSDVAAQSGLWQAVVAGELLHGEARSHAARLPTIDVLRSVGAQALGPLLLSFAQYLGMKASQFGYTSLHFASRDGFLLREAYEALRPASPELPPSRYFLASRRVCRAAAISSLDDILAVAAIDHFPMSIRQFLHARFLLSEAQIAALPLPAEELDRVISDAHSDMAMRAALETCRRPILDRCRAHAEAYRAYLASTGIDRAGAALVDIGYRGTTQRSIAHLTGKRINGLYLVTWPEAAQLLSRGLRYDAFLPSSGDERDPLIRHVQILELMCSATHGSIAAFGDDGAPVLLEGDISPRTGHALNALRQGALEFVRSVVAGYPGLPEWQPPQASSAIGTFVEFCRNPPLEAVDGLREHQFEDAFGGAVRPLIGTLSADHGAAAGDGCWVEGTAVLRRATARGFSTLSYPEGEAILDRFDSQGRTVPGFSAKDRAVS